MPGIGLEICEFPRIFEKQNDCVWMVKPMAAFKVLSYQIWLSVVMLVACRVDVAKYSKKICKKTCQSVDELKHVKYKSTVRVLRHNQRQSQCCSVKGNNDKSVGKSLLSYS